MNLDVSRIIADIKSTEERIRSVKKLLRQRWTRPMAEEQRAWLRLARRATELYVLRAQLRGRIHQRGRPPQCACGDVWIPARHADVVARRVGLAYARVSQTTADESA